jgi:ligand-binding sensor domain-containing protein
MYFATRNGILEFDGRSWNLIPANGSVYSLQVGSDGTLYWAGANGFGTVMTDDQGFHHVHALSPPEVKEVFESLIVQGNLYFLNNDGLYFYNDAMKEPVIIPSSNLTGGLPDFLKFMDRCTSRQNRKHCSKLKATIWFVHHWVFQ